VDFSSSLYSLCHPKVKHITSQYFEIKPAKPRTEKLKYLLELNLYSGPANDNNNAGAKKYTIDDFLELIQSSEDQIYKYLNYIEAFNIDGKPSLFGLRHSREN
jgi:hypothetical protein